MRIPINLLGNLTPRGEGEIPEYFDRIVIFKKGLTWGGGLDYASG